MLLKHLPMGVLADIAKTYSLTIWSTLVDGPLGFLPADAIEALYLACCTELKAKKPKRVTAAMALTAFQFAPDDEPDMWVDGRPQEGSPSTT